MREIHDARAAAPAAPDHDAGTHVFHRFPMLDLPVAVAGEGPYIIDAQGRRYMDASSGAAVSCLGHSHPAPIKAIQEQVARLAFAHTSFFTNEPLEELAAMLTESAPGSLDKVYFVSGGSEAIEAAIKLARQYFVEIGEPTRTRIISRRQSYHGNTLGALGAGGNVWRRSTFEPLLTQPIFVSPCYAYRDQMPEESTEAYARRLAQELEAEILAAGPKTVMCFIAETVAGATIGAVPPVESYFREVRDVCDRHGVLMILDEVMCGMGRTGTLFAYEQEQIVPDIVVVAKGLGAGYQPIGAVLASHKIFDGIVSGSGAFMHGHTYTGHTTACAAAVAVQKAIRDENLLENVRRRGDDLMDALQERFGNHHHVGDIRGRGLLVGLELVSERSTKAPFDARHKVASRIKVEGLRQGLICYPMGGVIDGVSGDHVMLAPPFIIDDSHIEEIVEKLGATVESVLADLT